MRRNVTLQEISDGNLYSRHDLVRVGTGDCKGCHACCCGTGHAVVLDPLDVYRMAKRLDLSFMGLMQEYLEARLIDGLVLPTLRMVEEEERCTFLNGEGRCRIHEDRPGICRLFPLARYYESGRFAYILQVGECQKSNLTKVKVKTWMDEPNLPVYEDFVTRWHYFLKNMEAYVQEQPEDAQAVSMYVLNTFYAAPYKEEEDFYQQFDQRLAEAKDSFGIEEEQLI